MKICIIEPFYGGSHRQWADDLARYLPLQKSKDSHVITLLTMPEKNWKWRMNGAAITLSSRANNLTVKPDLFLLSDMINVSDFKALLRSDFSNVPVALYFHENQFAYPIRQKLKSNTIVEKINGDLKIHSLYRTEVQMGLVNLKSALCSDRVYFNSSWNMVSFFEGAKKILNTFPDYRNLDTLAKIKRKSMVLPLASDFQLLQSKLERFTHACSTFETQTKKSSLSGVESPVILWNHRWESDKNPDLFFKSLFELKEKIIPFKLIVCGQLQKNSPKIFAKARKLLNKEIIHFGFAKSRNEYISLLAKADILPVTSNHDFFGLSVMEGIFAGCLPLLPKALSYPELYPPKKFPDFYYDHESDGDKSFTNSLITIVKDFPNKSITHNKQFSKIKKHIMRYDWKIVISKYESEFCKVTASSLKT